jgi:glucose-1-phosphate cytidylyltransferase
MKTIKHAVILAGGKGTRLAEQTKKIPKPLIEIGNVPILVHIINHLAYYGVEHIVVAGGYKVDLIKEYFMSDRYKYQGSVTFSEDGFNGHTPHLPGGLKTLTIADTGYSTGTAQRIKKAVEYFEDEDVPFYMTYGDSVSDVDLADVTKTFYQSGHKMTLTAVRFQERFGILKIDPDNNNKITTFVEKSMSKDEFINGGFMILSPDVVKSIDENDDDFSKDTMPRLQAKGQISAHIHPGFWAAMDTQRDYEELNKIYDKHPELFNRL